MTQTDNTIREILQRTKVIALVGASMKPERPSHYVGQFLVEKGYTVIPVNPGHAGEELFGQVVRASLADCPAEVDMVDVFRRSEEVPGVVDEALEALPNLRTVWMQLGISNAEAAAKAEARGLDVVQDRCPKMEYPRLIGA